MAVSGGLTVCVCFYELIMKQENNIIIGNVMYKKTEDLQQILFVIHIATWLAIELLLSQKKNKPKTEKRNLWVYLNKRLETLHNSLIFFWSDIKRGRHIIVLSIRNTTTIYCHL